MPAFHAFEHWHGLGRSCRWLLCGCCFCRLCRLCRALFAGCGRGIVSPESFRFRIQWIVTIRACGFLCGCCVLVGLGRAFGLGGFVSESRSTSSLCLRAATEGWSRQKTSVSTSNRWYPRYKGWSCVLDVPCYTLCMLPDACRCGASLLPC